MLNDYQTIFTTDIYVVYKDELLMLKRSMAKKAFPGFWLVPGGHIENNEDPASCAIRELREETGIKIGKDDLHFCYLAWHKHLDRKENYQVFAFKVNLAKKPETLNQCYEGDLQWVKISSLNKINNIFPPVKYYLSHVLGSETKAIFNRSEWEKTKLIRVLSETKIC